MASALLHGAVIAAVIGLARPHAGGAVNPPKRDKGIVFVPVHPDTRVDPPTDGRPAAGGAQKGQSSAPTPNFTSTEIPSIDMVVGEPVIPDHVVSEPSESLVRRGTGIDGGGLSYGGGVIDERAVDRAPSVIGRPPEPRFPAALREAGIQGRVVAEFVVDTLGRAEMDGLTLNAAQVPFGEAVRAVLPRFRFTPGEVGRRKVRTRVQLPFDFTLVR